MMTVLLARYQNTYTNYQTTLQKKLPGAKKLYIQERIDCSINNQLKERNLKL